MTKVPTQNTRPILLKMMSLSLRPFKLPERLRFLKDQKRGFKSVNISFTNPVMPHLRMSLSQRTQRETEKALHVLFFISRPLRSSPQRTQRKATFFSNSATGGIGEKIHSLQALRSLCETSLYLIAAALRALCEIDSFHDYITKPQIRVPFQGTDSPSVKIKNTSSRSPS